MPKQHSRFLATPSTILDADGKSLNVHCPTGRQRLWTHFIILNPCLLRESLSDWNFRKKFSLDWRIYCSCENNPFRFILQAGLVCFSQTFCLYSTHSVRSESGSPSMITRVKAFHTTIAPRMPVIRSRLPMRLCEYDCQSCSTRRPR